MFSSSSLPCPKKQQGLALLLLMIVIVLAVLSYVVAEFTVDEINLKRQEKTMASLKIAKEALLAFAMNYPDTGPVDADQGPGNLPCPDSDDDNGIQETVGVLPIACSSGGAGTIGRFPWETVQTGPLRDGDNELLWYAVSSNYVIAGTRQINSATQGQITLRNPDGSINVNGADPDAIIAVIIAPGKKLVRDDGHIQSRSSLADIKIEKNYLDIAYSGFAFEEDNAGFSNGNLNGFIKGPVYDAANNLVVNDIIEVITYRDLMPLVHAKVADEIGNVILEYFDLCRAYPYAATFNPASASFDSVDGLQGGMLPVDTAGPLTWNMDYTPYCNLTDIQFPDWVKAEEWHLHTYYAFAHTNPMFVLPAVPPPPADGIDCIPGTDCLTVIDEVTPDDKAVILMFAGRALDQDLTLLPVLNDQIRPSANLADYFEAENNDADNIFDLTPYNAPEIPEDYIGIVAP